MSKKTEITLDRDVFLKFVRSVLKDDHGISLDAHKVLCDLMLSVWNGECDDLWEEISQRIDATDDRFYIPN